MRDYRDAKTMAQTIRSALAAKGIKISVGDSLELIAKAFGYADWNTLSAAIKAAPKGESATAASPEASAQALEQLAKLHWEQLQAAIRASTATPGAPSPPATPPPTMPPRVTAVDALSVPTRPNKFSDGLVASLHQAVAFAAERRHQYSTLEHLLLALVDDPDASEVLEACQADREALRAEVTRYLDEELGTLVMKEPGEPAPTAGFHRVVQRAVIHVQSSGRSQVTGANILVAIFSERESHAAHFLEQQQTTRFDAVNFIANGFRKGDAAA